MKGSSQEVNQHKPGQVPAPEKNFNIIGVLVIIGCFVIGSLAGAWQYKSELIHGPLPFPMPEVGTPDPQVLNETPDLGQIMALQIPKPDASDAEWRAFLLQVEAIKMPRRNSAWSHISPLMALFSYIARYKPEVIYQKMSASVSNYSVIEDLLALGLLPDWYDHVGNKNDWLLSNGTAVKSLVLSKGLEEARKLTANAFNNLQSGNVSISLRNLQFASSAMTNDEMETVLSNLLLGNNRYDPRDVVALTHIPGIKKEELIRLIKKEAYPDKAMSSYMATATHLGYMDYIPIMAADVNDNAHQPTNFYCSACSLALYTDGLLGDAVTTAVESGGIVVANEGGQFVISAKDKKLQKGMVIGR